MQTARKFGNLMTCVIWRCRHKNNYLYYNIGTQSRLTTMVYNTEWRKYSKNVFNRPFQNSSSWNHLASMQGAIEYAALRIYFRLFSRYELDTLTNRQTASQTFMHFPPRHLLNYRHHHYHGQNHHHDVEKSTAMWNVEIAR